jgi:hypothetical protein
MGYSRDSFYRFKELYDAGGELALEERTRRKPILKNRTAPEVEAIIGELSLDRPAYGQIRIANELRQLEGARFGGGKRLVERSRAMGVEIVLERARSFRRRGRAPRQGPSVRVRSRRLRDGQSLDVTPAFERRIHHEQVGRAIAGILGVEPRRTPGPPRLGRARLGDELL